MALKEVIKTYRGGAAVRPYRLVVCGDDDDTVIEATGGTAPLLGISIELAAEAGERVDIALRGLAETLFGGTVTRGALITSDAEGRAMAAAGGDHVAGLALTSAVSGDIGPVLLAPGYQALFETLMDGADALFNGPDSLVWRDGASFYPVDDDGFLITDANGNLLGV